jgi:putative chitinase
MDITRLKGNLPDNVYAQLSGTDAQFGIDDELKLAHFLGQCDFESIQFTAVRENLNYSAKSLLQVFPKYFDAATAAAYARQPQKIGNRVYANRMGNGNEASGDGFNYRGRGYIQLTGKVNYKALGDHIGQDLVADPDLVATEYPLLSAAYFFQSRNLFAVCEQGATAATVTAVTKIVNGGTNGLADRIKAFNKFYGLLTGTTLGTPAPEI